MTTFFTSYCNVIPLGEQLELNYILLGFQLSIPIFRNVPSNFEESSKTSAGGQQCWRFYMDAERDSWDSILFVSFNVGSA
jgi:hypothetical protein